MFVRSCTCSSAGDLEALIRQNTLVMGTDAQFSQVRSQHLNLEFTLANT